MPISATFTGDFANFYEAVQKADAVLKSFGEGSARVGTQLNKMADQFSGRKLVQDAAVMSKAIEEIGGVSKLTEKELAGVSAKAQEAVAKMRALGMSVPDDLKKIADASKDANKATTDWMGSLRSIAGVMGVAFGAQQVVSFVKDVFAQADAIDDLASKWGVSAEAAQRYSQAAELTGSSAEAVGGAIGFMSKELGEGSEKYRQLAEIAGLSFEKLRAQSPEQSFRDMVSAIAAIEDPILQADLAVQFFGRGALELLPSIRNGFLDVADAQTVMADETVKRLADASDAWKAFTNKVTIYTGEMLGDMMKKQSVIFSSWGNFFTHLKIVTFQGADAAQAWVDAQEEGARATAFFEREVTAATGATTAAGLAGKSASERFAEWKKQQEGLTTSQKAHRKETDEWSKAIADAVRERDKLVSKLSGDEAMTAAFKYMAALKHTIPVQQMSKAAQAEINKVMTEAIAASRARGEQLPNEIYAIANASMAAVDAVVGLGNVLKDLPNQVKSVEAIPLDKLLKTGGALDLNKMLQGLGEEGAPAAPGKLSIFTGLGESLSQNLTTSILGALQGGGNVLQSALGTVGATLFDPKSSEFGKSISKSIGELPGFLGDALGAALPVVGSLIGPAVTLIGNQIGKLFGRDEESQRVNPMRDQFVAAAGGLHALNVEAQKVGLTLDDMLHADTVAEYEAAIAKLNAAFGKQDALAAAASSAFGAGKKELQALAEEAQSVYTFMVESGDFTASQLDAAFEAWRDSQAKALGLSSKKHEEYVAGLQKDLDGLKAKRDQLWEGIAAEAPEEVMGVIETQMRGEMAALDAQIKTQQATLEAATAEYASDLEAALADIKPHPLHVPVIFDVPDLPTSRAGPGMESYQHGTDGFRNFGSGTPVMLHGWEAVVPRDESTAGGAFATVPEAAPFASVPTGPTTNVVIHAQGSFFDTPADLQRLADKVNAALTAKFGLTNRLRTA